ncbi:transposase, MuDR, MULE transposase domain protein [Tanacetum coccineum]
MFSIQIHHGGNFQRYPGRRYFEGHVDIFDMVDVDLFTIVALNMMVIQLGYTGESSLDEGLPPPRVRETIEDITDEHGSIAAIEHRFEKMLMRQLSFEETELDGEAGFDDVAGVLPVSEEPDVGRTQELIMEEVMVKDYVSSREDGEQGIYSAYETQYDVQSSEDADVPFDNIGVTNLVPNDVLEGEDVDVIIADSFDSDPGNDNETSNYRRRRLAELSREMEGVINASGQWKYLFYTGHKFTTIKEAKDRVYLHSIKSIRNLKLYKNDSVRVRTRRDGKVLVFTMSQGTGPTGLNHGMEVGPSGSSGPTTRREKRKNTCTNDDSQACSSALDAHDKGDLYPWVLAKAKTEKEIRGDRVLQYSMLRDYVTELQSTNPNTTVKIAVEMNTGLDGAFKNGPFPGQVLAAVGLDSNNGIYPLAYALVEDKSKSSWCWFLQCLGDDIDMHPNLNSTSVIDKRKRKLTGIPCKHDVAACWNMTLNDRAAPPPEAWKFTCPTTLLPLKHHVRVGKPKKKRKRSKHDDEPFVKDGKLNKKGRIITCQSCENIGHNKATCKGQGQKATTGRSGVGAGIGLSVADCAGGAYVGVGSQGSSYTRWTKRRVQTAEKIADDLRDNDDLIASEKTQNIMKYQRSSYDKGTKVANHSGDELVDKRRPLKRKKVYAEYIDDAFTKDERQCSECKEWVFFVLSSITNVLDLKLPFVFGLDKMGERVSLQGRTV